MRELTEEETLSISGGTREGAPPVTSISHSPLGPGFVFHQGIPEVFQHTLELDIREAVDSAIMES